MANVYGRLSHRAGVCLSTLGPGATNLVTGVADAYLDRTTLVAITGQAALEKTHKELGKLLNVVSPVDQFAFLPVVGTDSCVCDRYTS